MDLAIDGQEAIETASKKDYYVVIMDLEMPGTGGIKATLRINALSVDLGEAELALARELEGAPALDLRAAEAP